MFCRICLDRIPSEDVNSKHLVDSFSYNKPVHGLCTTSFFQVVSSCLPDLNLHLPIDSKPRVCGPCSIKISDLYAMKQQSLEIEKIFLHYVKYHNLHGINEPIKLSEVASMYHSVNKKCANVVVVDLLKQLFAARSIKVPKTEEVQPSTNYQSTAKTEKLKTIINSNEDAVILVVEDEENSDLIHNLKDVICSDVKLDKRKSALESNRLSAETWFKMSQTNLLPKGIKPLSVEENEELTSNAWLNDETLLTPRVKKNANSVLDELCTENGNKVLLSSPKNSPRIENNTEKSPDLKHKTNNDKTIFNRSKSTRLRNNGGKLKSSRLEIPVKTWNLRSSSKKRHRPTQQYVKDKRKREETRKSRTSRRRNNDKPKTADANVKEETREEDESETEQNESTPMKGIEIPENNNESKEESCGSKKAHQCKKCEIHFSNEVELKIHLCSTTTVQCEICNILFADVKQWDDHKCRKPMENITISDNLVPERLKNDAVSIASEFDEPPPTDSDYESPMELNAFHITCEICDKDFFTKAEHNAHVAACHVSIGDSSSTHEDLTNRISQPHTLHLKDPLAQLVDELGSDEVENEQHFQCPQCTFTFGLESELLSHIQFHKETYQCEECHMKFKYAYLLSRHKNAEHTPRQCGICGKSFSLSHNLHSHMLSHLIPKESIIATCDLDPDLMAQELIVTDPLFDEATVEVVDHNPIIVGQFTPNEEQLSRMSRVVIPVVSQESEGLFCKTKEELELHEHDHMIDIKFKCQICGEIFPSRPAYRMHVNSNCVTTPQMSSHFVGSQHAVHKIVGKTKFTQRSNNNRLHECRLCQKKFISEHFLQIHFNNHVKGPKPKFFQCNVCSAAFSSKHGLNRHFATAHKM